MNIPENWIELKIGEIPGKTRAGGTPSRKRKEYYENGHIPFVKIEDITNSNKYLDYTNEYITEAGLKNSSAWIVPEYSILYTMYASYGIPIINKIPVSTNQAIIALLPDERIMDINYEYYYLLNIKPTLKKLIRGTTQENINAKIVKNLNIVIPPLNEQYRIVDKIESLFSKIDAGVESLKLTQMQLKQYRQSLLKSAIEGRLTEKWREEHKDELEKVCIETIDDELYFSNYVDITTIPQEWAWYPICALSDFLKGQRSPEKYYVDENHPEAKPYIRIQDFRTKKVSKYTRADWCLECYNTDTLIAMDGVSLGSSDYGWEGVLTHHILCLRPKQEFILPKYLFNYIKLNEKFFWSNKTGVCSPTLRQQYIKLLSLPLPPIKEQKRILELLEKSFTIIDNMIKSINKTIISSKSNKQSILKKAFEGRLVPQDPKDESASVLLERIKDERTSLQNKPNKSKSSDSQGRLDKYVK